MQLARPLRALSIINMEGLRQSWGNQRYYSLNDYLNEQFGEKVYKLSLDGGMTCPNRDGTLGKNGCIFCSKGGSGDFAASPLLSITQQIEEAKTRIKNKTNCTKFIAYFQSYTNTYAPVEYLEKIYVEAIENPEVVALSIGTRPDCIDEDIIELLSRLNQIKPVWIELGLQTIHEDTATFIQRGYKLPTFESTVAALNKIDINIIIHIIIGLPYYKESELVVEGQRELLETISYLSRQPIQGIKLQLLHILKDTALASYANEFQTLTLDEYIELLISCIEHIPPNIVIHRITGDGPKNLLIGPTWSGNKKMVLNTIHHTLKEKNTWQGRCYKPKYTTKKELILCNQKH